MLKVGKIQTLDWPVNTAALRPGLCALLPVGSRFLVWATVAIAMKEDCQSANWPLSVVRPQLVGNYL